MVCIFRFLALSIALFAGQSQDRRIVPVTEGPRRLALVIGNNNYPNQQLKNAVNDAEAVKTALGALGFEVQMRLNVTMPQMEDAANQFVNSVRPGDVALFYYSGHGIQIEGENYLIPVDFDARTAVDAKYKSYAASRMQENLEAVGVGLQILILDACRDNPYRSVRGMGGGLAPMQAGKGTYIAFATAPGKTADDNVSGPNGLFTGAFLRALKDPGLTLDEVFNRVRGSVSATRPDQVPWSTSSIVGEFYFRPAMAGAASDPRAATTQPPGLDAADETWELIKNSTSPEDLENFADAYPNSELAAGARIRAAQLRRASETASSVNVEAPKLSPSAMAPTAIRAGSTKVNPKDRLTYVWIPPGTFIMGCSSGDNECDKDESPAHEVTLRKGFWMGQTEVTQEAYRQVTGKDPSHFKGPKLPVEQVKWNEAQGYCSVIGMRLPTEAEWEYAARAGNSTARYGPIDAIAWYGGNSGGRTHEVATKQANAFGLFDMLGNVRQWVADQYGNYSLGAVSDPQGTFNLRGGRVVRGGSWVDVPKYVRASKRSWAFPDVRPVYLNARHVSFGFRCAGE